MDIAKDGLSLVQVPQNLRQKVLAERRKVSLTFDYLSMLWLCRLQKLLADKLKNSPNILMRKTIFYPVINMIFRPSSIALPVPMHYCYIIHCYYVCVIQEN